MGWVVGIIGIIIVITFWRIFLPLGLVAVVGIVGLYSYFDYQEGKRKEEKVLAAQLLRSRISNAQKKASPDGKTWQGYSEKDPASGKLILRSASILSDDGLCSLVVQKRIDGRELTGIDCPGIEISDNQDISIKFDTSEISKNMDINNYSDSQGVYIPSYQSGYAEMKYEDFIAGLTTASAVAIKIPAAESFWVRFTLREGAEAIGQLGKEINIVER